MTRYKQGIKNLDQNNLVSADYSDHAGVSSSVTFTPDNSPEYSNANNVESSATARVLISTVETISSTVNLFSFLSPNGEYLFEGTVLRRFTNRNDSIVSSTFRSGTPVSSFFSSDNSKVLQIFYSGWGYDWYYSDLTPTSLTLSSSHSFTYGANVLAISNSGVALLHDETDLILWDLENDTQITTILSLDASNVFQANQFGDQFHLLYRSPAKETQVVILDIDDFTIVNGLTNGSTLTPNHIRFDVDTGDYYYITNPNTISAKIWKNDEFVRDYQYANTLSDKADVVANATKHLNGAYYGVINGVNSIGDMEVLHVDRANGYVYVKYTYSGNSTQYIGSYLLVPEGYKNCYFSGLEGYVLNPTVVGQVAYYGNSQDLFTKSVNIPAATNDTYLKASLKFTSGLVSTSNNFFVTDTVQGIRFYEEDETSHTMGFVIESNTAGRLATYYNSDGDISVKIPEGTTEITLRMQDDDLHNFARYNTSSFVLSNLRVYDYSSPSIGIVNDTKPDNSYVYIDVENVSSLEVESESDTGFYDIILDPQDKDYFWVGDKFHNINYRPLDLKRNACLQFSTLDLSDVNDDHPIELLIDIIDLDTTYAQDVYNNDNLREFEVDEFYKNGGKIGVRPLVAIGSFANSVSAVHNGSNNGVYATPYNVADFKCGLQIYDITNAVQNSILNGQSNILVWLFYDQLYARDEYNVFKVGSTELNKPRIRYKRNA